MKKKSVGVGIGTCSLMMIFTVLCLTIFAVLSLLQANSAYLQSTNYADSITNYYAADNKAMQIKAMIENNSIDENMIKEYDIQYAKDQISYQVMIDDNAYLDVILDKNFAIIKWRGVSDVDGDYGSQGFDF